MDTQNLWVAECNYEQKQFHLAKLDWVTRMNYEDIKNPKNNWKIFFSGTLEDCEAAIKQMSKIIK
jgi:hypothetical protein